MFSCMLVYYNKEDTYCTIKNDSCVTKKCVDHLTSQRSDVLNKKRTSNMIYEKHGL